MVVLWDGSGRLGGAGVSDHAQGEGAPGAMNKNKDLPFTKPSGKIRKIMLSYLKTIFSQYNRAIYCPLVNGSKHKRCDLIIRSTPPICTVVFIFLK